MTEWIAEFRAEILDRKVKMSEKEREWKNIGKAESQNGNGLQNLVHNINMATASSLDVPVLEYKSTDFCSILFDSNRSV